MNVYIGIDLGTTNSSIAYVVDAGRRRDHATQDVTPVKFESENGEVKTDRLPSLVALGGKPDGKQSKLVGWPVIAALKALMERKTKQQIRLGREMLRSFKSDMGTNRVYHACQLPDCKTPRDAAAIVLRELLDTLEAELKPLDSRECHVVITVPASFSELARRETVEAAHRAGLSKVSLIDEPVAALVDCLNSPKGELWLSDGQPRNILVYDYGGGTCDLSLVRAQLDESEVTGVRVTNLAISNYLLLGGDDVDRAVMRGVVWPQILERHGEAGDLSEVDDIERRRIEDQLTFTAARDLKERISNRISRRRKAESRDSGDAWDPFTEKQVDLKESTGSKYPIELQGRTLSKSAFTITETQFREVMAPFMVDPVATPWEDSSQSLLWPVYEVLAKANLNSDELDFIVLHGGATRNPLVHDALSQLEAGQRLLFPRLQIVTTVDIDTSVARGAALECYFRNGRGQVYVRPIMPEDLGVLAKDDREVPVIAAGTPVPYPEYGVQEVDAKFFIQRDNQRELLIPLYVGDAGRLAAVIRIPDLPAGLHAGDEVRLMYSIDGDKRTHWTVQVAGGEPRAAQTLASPWTAYAPKHAQRALQELRAELRTRHDRGQEIDEAAQNLEIRRMNRAAEDDRDCERVLRRIEEYAEEFGLDALLLNFKAMTYGQLGDNERAIQALRQALEAEPDDDIYAGNLGSYLKAAGRTREAIPYLQRAAAHHAYVYPDLVNALMAVGREEEALNTARVGLRIARAESAKHLGDPGPWYVISRMAGVLGIAAEQAEARVHLRRLELNERLGGDSNAQIASEDSGFFVTSHESEEGGEEEDGDDTPDF